MAKQMMFDVEARRKMVSGVEQLARVVKLTLGPGGKNVILEKSFGPPLVCNDGATIAKEVELEDPFENMGAHLAREAALKTNDVAGDGTTTATVLAEAIVKAGFLHVTAGTSPVALRNGIQKAVAAVVEKLGRMARKVKSRAEIEQVGTISSNQDAEIGHLMADAIERVGRDGVITIEEGKSAQTEVEFVEGLSFDKGYLSPYFITDPKALEAIYEDVRVLVHEQKISSNRDLIPVLDKIAGSGEPLLIIAEDVESEVLATLVVNRLRGTLNCVAVKAPGFGDGRKAMLEDIAIMTGGQCISKDLGVSLENVTLDQLGKVRKVRVSKNETILIGGAGAPKAIQARADSVRTQIKKTTSDYDREKLEKRLAKLTASVAIIHVGALTEAALKEKKLRVEDALNATRAAAREGIVAGGGVALLRAARVLDRLQVEGDERYGLEIVRKACAAPIRQIAVNSGEDGSVIVQEALERKDSEGFDAMTLKWVDMFQAGIIDPVLVVRSALQNAASIGVLVLTTDTLVASLKDRKAVRGAMH
jgi:chaperonin GroEL